MATFYTLGSANDSQIISTTGRNGAARIVTASTTAAGCVLVLEVEGATIAATGIPEYVAIQMWNQLTSAWVSNLTGASQTGFADVPATNSIRIRRTDSTGGLGACVFTWKEG